MDYQAGIERREHCEHFVGGRLVKLGGWSACRCECKERIAIASSGCVEIAVALSHSALEIDGEAEQVVRGTEARCREELGEDLHTSRCPVPIGGGALDQS